MDPITSYGFRHALLMRQDGGGELVAHPDVNLTPGTYEIVLPPLQSLQWRGNLGDGWGSHQVRRGGPIEVDYQSKR
jgi:hypothetical protein